MAVTRTQKARKPVPKPKSSPAKPTKADPPPPKVLVVVTTVGTEEQALDIAHHLVENHLVACVNILPGVRSVFFWKGKVNDDREFLLIAKSVPANFEAVRAAMKKLNAYELPEILGFDAGYADAAFAAWVKDTSTHRRG